jgi:mRNA interferase MazF
MTLPIASAGLRLWQRLRAEFRTRPPNEVVIQPSTSGLQVVTTIRLDQVRTVDRQRLIRKLGKADDTVMRKIDDAISISLGLVKL